VDASSWSDAQSAHVEKVLGEEGADDLLRPMLVLAGALEMQAGRALNACEWAAGLTGGFNGRLPEERDLRALDGYEKAVEGYFSASAAVDQAARAWNASLKATGENVTKTKEEDSHG